MAKSKLNKTLRFLIFIIIFEIVFFSVTALVYNRKNKMPLQIYTQWDYYIACKVLQQEKEPIKIESKSYYREQMEILAGFDFYIYKESNIRERFGKDGLSLAIIRTVILDENLDGYDYCVTCLHEFLHIKEFIEDEEYLSFKTFKMLYESEEFHNIGVMYAISVFDGFYYGEYDIRAHIVNYLTNK